MNQQQENFMRLHAMLSHKRRSAENNYIFGLIAIVLAISALSVCAVVYIFTR